MNETTTQGNDCLNKRTRTTHSHEGNSPPDFTVNPNPTLDKDTTSTLQNYEDLLNYWPLRQIQNSLQSNKALTDNCAPAAVQHHVKRIYDRFKRELLMMAMIGGVSELTIKSYM